jgi:outer membrane protein
MAPHRARKAHPRKRHAPKPARAAAPAASKDEQLEEIPHETSHWRASVGVTGMALPRYDGARQYMFFPLPLLELSYKDWFSFSVLDGLQVNLVRDGAFTAGPLVKFDFTQSVPRERPINWIGTFHTGLEGGVFAEYRFSAPLPLKLRAELLQSFNARQGLSSKVELLASHDILPAVSVEFGPVLRAGNALALDSRFGVDFAQSTLTGWPVFSPGGGIASFGLETNIDWRVTNTVKISAFAEYERLVPRVAASPVVRNGGSPNQFALGLSLAYRFLGP